MKTSVTFLLLAFFGTSCGLGTEVGNGFKPEKKVRAGASPDAKDSVGPGTDEDGVDGTETSEGSNPDGPATDEAAVLPAKFSVDWLTAACASPFALSLQPS